MFRLSIIQNMHQMKSYIYCDFGNKVSPPCVVYHQDAICLEVTFEISLHDRIVVLSYIQTKFET